MNSTTAVDAPYPILKLKSESSYILYARTFVLPQGPPPVMTAIKSKLLNAPTIVTTTAIKVAGLNCGRIIFQNIVKPEAPSIRPASIMSLLTAVKPVI